MATISITHTWSDSSDISIHIEVDTDYPDALDEARAQAVRALREAVAALTTEDE